MTVRTKSRIADCGLRIDGRARGIRNHRSQIRNAFTLVELLVAITVFLILAGMTIVMVNNTFEAERLKSGVRQVQSYLEGARDRAIYADAPRGVRLLYRGNPSNPLPQDPVDFTIDSMVYVKPLDDEIGLLRVLQDPSQSNEYRIIELQDGSDWGFMVSRGLIDPTGAKIFIASGEGTAPTTVGLQYTLKQYLGSNRFEIAEEYMGDTTSGPPLVDRYFEVEMLNGVLPNSEPVRLPDGIVLHLTAAPGALPNAWGTPNGTLDLMFSPRGTLTGAPAAKGIIHLVICDIEDCPDSSADEVSAFFTSPSQTTFDSVEGGLRYVTIFTRTGQIASNPVKPEGPAFEFALTGEVSEE